MARRKGGAIVLHAPDGREWEGAAAAVRAEGMTPWRRRMLADALRALRMATEPGTERRATAVARRRLEAIREAEADRHRGMTLVGLPEGIAVRAEATARAVGCGAGAFIAKAVAAAVDGVSARCMVRLTRHESAALARIDGGPR